MEIEKRLCWIIDLELPDPHGKIHLAITPENITVNKQEYIGGGSVLSIGDIESGGDGSGQRVEVVLRLAYPNPDGLGEVMPEEVSEILGELMDIGISLLNRGCVISQVEFDEHGKVVQIAPLLVGAVNEAPTLSEGAFSFSVASTIALSREIPFAFYSYQQQSLERNDQVYILKRLQNLTPAGNNLTW